MKKNILYLLVPALLLFSACEKFLDVKPAGKLIPEKGDVASFEKLLNNNYTFTGAFLNNNKGCRLNYLTDDIEMSVNQATYGWPSGHPNIDSYYAYTFKLPYTNPNESDLYTWWMDYYRAVEYFNVCIDGVNSVRTSKEQVLADATISQARVGRAWLFFNLALIYGPAYNPAGENSVKTIPMRTQSEVMAPMEDLSTTGQVFDRVLKEIHASIPKMPAVTSSPSRFNLESTYAFLAYYHLFTQKYDSVAFYADRALNQAIANKGSIGNLIYDMNKFSWSDPAVSSKPDNRNASSINTSEGSIPLTANYNKEILLYRICANAPSSSYAYPSAEFLSLFDASFDLRRQYFFFEYNGYKSIQNGVTYDDGRKILNYQSKLARTSGFTYPELILMRAEGRARTGNLTGAVDDINLLKKYRMKPGYSNFSSSNQNDIINEIVKERRRELPVASPKRFLDIKRFSLESGKPWAKSTITHTINGEAFSAPVNLEYFTMPIPNDVILKNPQWGIEIDTRPWSSTK